MLGDVQLDAPLPHAGFRALLRRPLSRALADPATGLVGRADDLAALFKLAREHRVVTAVRLKRGPDAHGTVGLWVDNGTDGHFRNLSVRKETRRP